MRYPEGHKEGVRARIVEAAARALRQEGIDAVSIPKLMKMAGLTHGGFYVHFRDRDELVAEAVAFGANESAERIFAGDERPAAEAFKAYLSELHLGHPEHGCVLATLASEGQRQSASVRRAFKEAARGFLRIIEKKLHPKSKPGTLGDDALVAASTLVGAMILARVVQDDALADRILTASAQKAAAR